MRDSRLSFLVIASAIAAMGCESPCKPGFQRYGDKCVRSPDAGSGENERDSGRQDGAGGGTAGGANDALDAATACMRNVCGGCKEIADAQNLGMPCEAGKGDCKKAGAWVCDGKDVLRCSGVPGEPGNEACGGGDEDCDGKVDESSVAEAADGSTFWFADCDGDGFAPMGALSVRTCAAPEADDSGCNTGAARWIQKSPQTTADCSDVDPAAFPGQTAYSVDPIADTAADYDFDCDGEQTANLPGITGLIGTQNVGCDTNILSWVVGISNDDCYDSTSGFAGACGKTAVSVYQGFKSGGTKLVCGQTGATTCQYVYSARVPCR